MNPLAVQWLDSVLSLPWAQVQPLVGELRSHILQGNKAHEPQLLSLCTATKTLHAATKAQRSQISK